MSKEDIIRMGEAVKSCICAEQQGVEQRLRLTVDGKTYAVTVEEIKNPNKRIGCKTTAALGWTYCVDCPYEKLETACEKWRLQHRATVESEVPEDEKIIKRAKDLGVTIRELRQSEQE